MDQNNQQPSGNLPSKKDYLKEEYKIIDKNNDPVYTELVTCKVKLLLEKAFFGVFLVSMDLKLWVIKILVIV